MQTEALGRRFHTQTLTTECLEDLVLEANWLARRHMAKVPRTAVGFTKLSFYFSSNLTVGTSDLSITSCPIRISHPSVTRSKSHLEMPFILEVTPS